jgi:hypothetical protein
MLPVLLTLALAITAKVQFPPSPVTVALNPQPLPPGIYEPGHIFVNPQPLPPSAPVDIS